MWTYIILTVLSFWTAPAQAQEMFKSKRKEKKEEMDQAISEAEKEAEKAKQEKQARVIVLRWNNVTADHENPTLQRNVLSAINRTEVTFLPAIDIFQGGREIRDRTIPPERQPAMVPDENIAKVMMAVNNIAGTPWNALTPNQWQEEGQKLLEAAEHIWFIDRVELREPIFQLYAQMGNAANNMNNYAPPFFERVGSQSVNYYWYLAATFAEQDPALMNKVSDSEIAMYIQEQIDNLRSGRYPSMKVDFHLEDNFDKEEFDKEYEVFLNGLPREVDSNGQADVFLGRTDIYLKRKDYGHGLSDRYIADKTDDKAYPPLENANKLMTSEFRNQLFRYENECSPLIGDNILTHIAIYAKLHPEVSNEIYIAVPKEGNPNKVWVWRFDPRTTTLNQVANGNEEFPVRFVATTGVGLLFNRAQMNTADVNEILNPEAASETVSDGDIVEDVTEEVRNRIEATGKYIPFPFELRAHYNRWMVNFGVEYGLSGTNGHQWAEYYQTPQRTPGRTEGLEQPPIQTGELYNCEQDVLVEVTNQETGEVEELLLNRCNVREVLYQPTFNKARFFGVGYLFGPDASFGLGPRVAFRSSFLNAPHSWVGTGHFGWAITMPGTEPYNKRVRFIADVDLRMGGMIHRRRSLYIDTQVSMANPNNTQVYAPKAIEPLFGLLLNVGVTF